MNSKMKLVALLSAALMTACATSNNSLNNNPAVTVEILWADLDTFTDIDAGTTSKQNFRKNLTRELEKYITNLAGQLPDGYQFYMVIDNLDLAGKVNDNYWMGREALRVYDTWFNPEITFTYRVKNATGEFVAAQDKFSLKNTHNGKFPANRFMSKPFAYEKYLLKSWFDHVLLPHVKP